MRTIRTRNGYQDPGIYGLAGRKTVNIKYCGAHIWRRNTKLELNNQLEKMVCAGDSEYSVEQLKKAILAKFPKAKVDETFTLGTTPGGDRFCAFPVRITGKAKAGYTPDLYISLNSWEWV